MRDQILKYVIDSKIIEKVSNSLIFKLQRNKEDFIQEIYLMILQIPEDRLLTLFNKNQLFFYIVGIARNQALYYKSVFNKKYNDKTIEYTDCLEKMNVEYHE